MNQMTPAAQRVQANLAGELWPPASVIPPHENPDDFENYAGIRYRRSADPDKTPHLDVPSRADKNAVSMMLSTRVQAPAMSSAMVLPLQHMLHHTPSAVSPRPGMLEAGDPAPEFTILAEDGHGVSLAGFRGRPLLVMFMRVLRSELFCPYSIPAIVRMEDTYQEFQRRGVQVALVLPTSLEHAVSFKRALGLSYPIYADPEWSAHDRYARFLGILPLQASAIIDANGVVRYIWCSDGGPGGDSIPPMPSGLLKQVDRLFATTA